MMINKEKDKQEKIIMKTKKNSNIEKCGNRLKKLKLIIYQMNQ